ncbi:MAG: hypothetical protein JWN32_432 [Solirubrobacterales bacterium]|nr:hypothetical protein [Solirubrobacterales bacterium]
MSAVDTLAAEQSQRRWAVPAAAIAGVLPLAAAVVVNAGFHNAPNNRPGGLLYFNDHLAALTISSVMLVLGATGLAGALIYLYRAVRARETEGSRKLPRITPYLIGVGATLYALTGTLLSAASPPLGLFAQIVTSDRISKFASHDGQTWQQADDLFKTGALTAVNFGQIICSLFLVASVVMISLAAMRAGLLSKFMGYVGVFVGALLLIPIFSTVPVVQAFWLVGLAVLFAGRWPNGVPPAWASGVAEPWPSAQQVREQAAEKKGTRARGGGRVPAPEPVAAPAAPGEPGAARRKRKRKR